MYCNTKQRALQNARHCSKNLKNVFLRLVPLAQDDSFAAIAVSESFDGERSRTAQDESNQLRGLVSYP